MNFVAMLFKNRFGLLFVGATIFLLLNIGNSIVSGGNQSLYGRYLIVKSCILLILGDTLNRLVVSVDYNEEAITFNMYLKKYVLDLKQVKTIDFFRSTLLMGLCFIRIHTNDSSRLIYFDCPYYSAKKKKELESLIHYIKRFDGGNYNVRLKFGFK